MSWVILIGFVVALSGMLLGWMQEYSQNTVDTMQERLYNTEMCESISMSIDEIFCKNPQILNIVITNRNYIRIDQIILREYTEDKQIHVYYLNKTIKPTKSAELEVPIQGNISSVEAIPVFIDKESYHICEEKKISVMKVTGNC